MARQELAMELRTAVHRAAKEQAPVRREAIAFRHEGGERTVNLEVLPLHGAAGGAP